MDFLLRKKLKMNYSTFRLEITKTSLLCNLQIGQSQMVFHQNRKTRLDLVAICKNSDRQNLRCKAASVVYHYNQATMQLILVSLRRCKWNLIKLCLIEKQKKPSRRTWKKRDLLNLNSLVIMHPSQNTINKTIISKVWLRGRAKYWLIMLCKLPQVPTPTKTELAKEHKFAKTLSMAAEVLGYPRLIHRQDKSTQKNTKTS